MIYFVSGHLTTTPEEFQQHYLPVLERVLSEDPDSKFVMGDARGTDRLTQLWARERGLFSRVTVYHMFASARNNAGPFHTQGGYETDTARDEAMTAASQVDVAWVRPGRETSGTAQNLARRKTLKGTVVAP
jgi:hypothetical protein